MWDYVLSSLWFFLPAGVANMAPVFASKIRALSKFNKPLDGGRTWRGKRIFGQNKTLRGFVAGFLAAYLVLALQKYFVDGGIWPQHLTWLDYSSHHLAILGFAFSVGALGGDAIKSFFKRQFGKNPGESWFPFDQIDYIIGGLLATAPFLSLGINEVLAVFVVWFVLHPVATTIGWLLRLKDSPI